MVFGTGDSARSFYENHASKYDIIGVIDRTRKEDFHGYKVTDIDSINCLNFDLVVVGSWAIENIALALLEKGVPSHKIFWYQHHKNRVVPYSHEDVTNKHPIYEINDILYAFYDLDISRTRFDILGFLACAEHKRRDLNLKTINVVLVNASNCEWNVRMQGVINLEEHCWRKRQVLQQTCALLPSCSGVTMTSSRNEAKQLYQNANNIFPDDYAPNNPVAHWEFNHLFDLVEQGKSPQVLRAASEPTRLVKLGLSAINPKHKRIVTITMRSCGDKTARNSNQTAWVDFIHNLDTKHYLPIVVPDTENALLLTSKDFAGAHLFTAACFNVEIRMALYEQSFINLGVNNGPTHLWALSPTINYLMFKQITENYEHSSIRSFKRRKFKIGGDFPGANAYQKFIWEDDELEVITREFTDMADKLQQEREAVANC